MRAICNLDDFMENIRIAFQQARKTQNEPLYPKPPISNDWATIRFSESTLVLLRFEGGTENITQITAIGVPDGSQLSGYHFLFTSAIAIASSGLFGGVNAKKGFQILKSLGLFEKSNIRDGYTSNYIPFISRFGIWLEVSSKTGFKLVIKAHGDKD